MVITEGKVAGVNQTCLFFEAITDHGPDLLPSVDDFLGRQSSEHSVIKWLLLKYTISRIMTKRDEHAKDCGISR